MRGLRAKATVVAGGAGLLMVIAGIPAQAAVGSVSEVLSNNQVSAAPVTYTSSFQVGVAAASVVVALPTSVTNLATTNVTVSTSPDGTTFTVVAPSLLTSFTYGMNKLGVNLPAPLVTGEWIRVAVTGLSNPTAVGNIDIGLADDLTALTSTTLDAISGTTSSLSSLVLADVGSVVAGIVAQATNGTTTNLAVAPVLSMAWGAASHSLSLTPSPSGAGTAITGTSDSITVSTNAQAYSIQALISNGALLWQGGSTATLADLIPLTYSVGSAPAVPFGTSYAAVTPPLTGLTNSATTVVNYGGSVDLSHPAGTYVGTVSYLVVPSF